MVRNSRSRSSHRRSPSPNSRHPRDCSLRRGRDSTSKTLRLSRSPRRRRSLSRSHSPPRHHPSERRCGDPPLRWENADHRTREMGRGNLRSRSRSRSPRRRSLSPKIRPQHHCSPRRGSDSSSKRVRHQLSPRRRRSSCRSLSPHRHRSPERRRGHTPPRRKHADCRTREIGRGNWRSRSRSRSQRRRSPSPKIRHQCHHSQRRGSGAPSKRRSSSRSPSPRRDRSPDRIRNAAGDNAPPECMPSTTDNTEPHTDSQAYEQAPSSQQCPSPSHSNAAHTRISGSRHTYILVPNGTFELPAEYVQSLCMNKPDDGQINSGIENVRKKVKSRNEYICKCAQSILSPEHQLSTSTSEAALASSGPHNISQIFLKCRSNRLEGEVVCDFSVKAKIFWGSSDGQENSTATVTLSVPQHNQHGPHLDSRHRIPNRVKLLIADRVDQVYKESDTNLSGAIDRTNLRPTHIRAYLHDSNSLSHEDKQNHCSLKQVAMWCDSTRII